MRYLLTLALFTAAASLHAADTKPLRALLVCGGCCHDYAAQNKILSKGISERANVVVDVIHSEDRGTAPQFPLYENPEWSKGYDIIIHDECAAGIKDEALVNNILNAHKTVPAINLHCAMHSYHVGPDNWSKYLGLKSNSHGPQEPIAISIVDQKHPITEPLTNWTTIKEELYNNVTVFDAHPLMMGKQTVKQKDGTTKDVEYIVAWTNETQGARTFSTTIGHNNGTVEDARYLDLVTRGLLWACNKLTPEYLTPYKGEAGKVTTLPAPKKEEPKASAAPVAPKDASGVTATASSEESGKGNFAWKAVDNDPNTRWCANSSDQPQWLQLELEKPANLSGIKISWESGNNAYKHKVEGSTDGKTWTTLSDASSNDKGGDNEHAVSAKDIRFVKITCNGSSQGGWSSIREVSLKGEGIKAMTPKVAAAQKAEAKKAEDKANDPYAKEGNIEPKIVKLTAEQEAEILKDVKVPDGFEVTLFANSQAANYPVYVAAAPNGDLYVSSDGNGSLGRNPKRGRIIRLRDLDGDGRADETKVFCEVDSPRGLVWDHDRLYLVHPPHLSAFIDKDGDGVSEEQKVLVKDIAFGFKDRPADHTTNGLSLGIDGWLYIAGGDFGFMKAEGTDGKTLQHRGGGVIRVRPDGTGLEIYSTGTRNILEVAISPLMDIFARDNTNDGGGWNVRFHHFTGLDDHGYPRLYKNFNDEAVQPLADYGGGSGCGAVYIDEPGFGTWNNAPFTADWGTGALWHHEVKPKGATFEETRKPEPFIKMTRPTDADVDGMSRVYCASWKGATFNWEGPDVGYIVQVKPKGFKTEPLPDFKKASDAELVKQLESPSYRRRMEAQRILVGRAKDTTPASLLIAEAGNTKASPESRVTALYGLGISQHGENSQFKRLGHKGADLLTPTLINDPVMREHVIRAGLDFLAERGAPKEVTLPKNLSFQNIKTYSTESARVRLQWVKFMSLGFTNVSFFQQSLVDEDPVVRHTAIEAFGKGFKEMSGGMLSFREGGKSTGESTSYISNLFAAADNARNYSVAAELIKAAGAMHDVQCVDQLIERLSRQTNPEHRRAVLSALCRLHFTEGEWKGDSWGTRPDTRGPYYQPEAWSETPKIAAALKDALSKASPDEAAFLVSELNRNRIQFNEALERILTLAAKDDKLIPDAVSQMATAETIPAAGIPLLVKAAQMTDVNPAVLAQAITALAKTDSAEGCRASLGALVVLSKAEGAGKEKEAASTAFLGAPKLENHHQLLEVEAEKVGTATAAWADAALLTLSARKTGSPESIELSGKALEAGWQNPKRRIQILKAAGDIKHNPYADKIIAALDDTDPEVAKVAKQVAGKMKLEKKTKDSGPLISTMKVEDVLAQVIKTKGDVALGEQLFTRQTCVACHTVSMDQAPKGPYLGNIAQTYKRPDLAMNVLDPNKTIAQGFVSEVFVHKDGTTQMGFVTFESADTVKFRNITAQEFTYAVKDITKRDKLPISIMPPGLVGTLTVHEFASLLDYMESLSKK